MNGDLLFFEKKERLFLTSDTHFGHRNIIKYCERPFYCIEEMDDALIANWNSAVRKNVKGQKSYLNHYPFLCYGGSYRNTWQLYGHVHTSPANRGLDAPRLKMLMPMQYDVGVDNNNDRPISFEQVKKIIRNQIELSNTGID